MSYYRKSKNPKNADFDWETIIGQRKTPIIITLCKYNYQDDTIRLLFARQYPFKVVMGRGQTDDKSLTEYDLKDYIEHGLRIIRFRMTNFISEDKLKLLKGLQMAAESCCKKYNLNGWPIAVAVDIPNASSITGFLSEELPSTIVIKKGSIVDITSSLKFYSKCSAKKIYINDPYTLPTLRPGNEISLGFGKIILTCLDHVDSQTVKCKVIKEGVFRDQELVSFRGIKIKKPPLLKRDLDEIEFAKQCDADLLIIHSVRNSGVISKIKALFKGSRVPFILSALCEAEGLHNADEIIAESDGVLLAREILAVSLIDNDRIFRIQLQIGSKCKKLGKPFFISGNILEQSLPDGHITGSDMIDVFAAQEQGAGFLLRNYPNPHNITTILRLINEICMDEDPIQKIPRQFWNMPNEIPVNAADGCITAAILTAKLVGAKAIIVSTVTGKTAKQLSRYCDDIYVVAVTTNPVVARRLQLYKGLICIIYDHSAQKTSNRRYSNEKITKLSKTETDPRVMFATAYATKFEVLKYTKPFLVLKKGSSNSSYCDEISIWEITERTDQMVCSAETKVHRKNK